MSKDAKMGNCCEKQTITPVYNPSFRINSIDESVCSICQNKGIHFQLQLVRTELCTTTKWYCKHCGNIWDLKTTIQDSIGRNP